MKPVEKDISHEEVRVYVFPYNCLGDVFEHTIRRPTKLVIRESGAHMVQDYEGITHYIDKGWKVITWKTKGGEVNRF
jgi:hypothetical protein